MHRLPHKTTIPEVSITHICKKESIEIVFLRLLLIKNISGKRTEYRSKAIKHTGKEQG